MEKPLSFKGFADITAGIVKWPMSVIRLTGTDKARLVDLADRILLAWRGYTDASATIFAETDGEPHNTITPIARRRGDAYELDLVLRNNLTTEEHPLGVFHPHADKHNIKKENIGLIEVMGLAVLPSRLKKELYDLADAIVNRSPLTGELEKHAAWVDTIRSRREINADNAMDVLMEETGRVFAAVLEDAGVYKCTPAGREAFLRFVDYVNQ